MVPKHFGNGVQLVHLDQANTFHLYKLCRLYALVSSTLPYVQPSPPLRKKITGRGADFPIFFLSRGDGCTQAIFYLYLCCHDTFQLQVTQRSTRKGLHGKWYNVGKQKPNCSHSFVLGEVTLTSFFLKMYLYKPFLGLH